METTLLCGPKGGRGGRSVSAISVSLHGLAIYGFGESRGQGVVSVSPSMSLEGVLVPRLVWDGSLSPSHGSAPPAPWRQHPEALPPLPLHHALTPAVESTDRKLQNG